LRATWVVRETSEATGVDRSASSGPGVTSERRVALALFPLGGSRRARPARPPPLL